MALFNYRIMNDWLIIFRQTSFLASDVKIICVILLVFFVFCFLVSFVFFLSSLSDVASVRFLNPWLFICVDDFAFDARWFLGGMVFSCLFPPLLFLSSYFAIMKTFDSPVVVVFFDMSRCTYLVLLCCNLGYGLLHRTVFL